MMKINIYYGGRGLIEDPTIYVMNKLTEVLEELRVEVTRYNLYEEKNGISMLPNTLKEADGIILATTVEWLGIGGLMQQFLDACWLYADKEKMSHIYMLPVVMASTYGEREAEYMLTRAWEMLGGIPCNGLCAYVEDHIEFETNPDYAIIIEKSAETLYRTISQKAKVFPNSSNAVKQNVLRSNTIDLTPQESEQLSMYVSDDTYVKKQKEDIEELAQIFKEMLGDTEKDQEHSTDNNTDKNTYYKKENQNKKRFSKNETIGNQTIESKKVENRKVESRRTENRKSNTNSFYNKTIKNNYEVKNEASDVGSANGEFIHNLKNNFQPLEGFSAVYTIQITDINKTLVVDIKEDKLKCYYGSIGNADVIAKTTQDVMKRIVNGKLTFQKAFMSGELTAKGNFKTLRTFDTIFEFNIL